MGGLLARDGMIPNTGMARSGYAHRGGVSWCELGVTHIVLSEVAMKTPLWVSLSL